MGALFSPWTWIAIAIWSGMCAAGGASVMEKIDAGVLARIQAESAQHEVDAAKRAKTITEIYSLEADKARANAAAQRAQRIKAQKTLEENQREFGASAAGRHLAGPGFVQLWNHPGADTGDAGVGADVRATRPGADAGPADVAIGDVPVAAAKEALGACRDQVIGLQAYVKLLLQQLADYVKGMA